MQLIRGSELVDFLRCRLRWKLAWIDSLESKKPNNKLFPGTMMHKFLEVYYQSGEAQKATEALFQIYNDTDIGSMDEVEAEELFDTVYKVSKNYVDHYWMNDAKYQTLATELTFAIPLDDEIGYTGTIDWVFRDESGRMMLGDHKLTASLDKYDKNSDLDRQISRYLWAMQQLANGNGYLLTKSEPQEWLPVSESGLDLSEPQGFVYNLILRDYPVPPKVLKKGDLSKDKSQNTTYQMYLEKLYEIGHIGLDDGEPAFLYTKSEDYREILDHLKNYPKEYFRRIEVRRNQAEIDAAMQEFYYVASDIKLVQWALRHGTGEETIGRTYRNITDSCPWDCQFKEICQASMDGSNVDFLKESLYKEKDNSGTPTL